MRFPVRLTKRLAITAGTAVAALALVAAGATAATTFRIGGHTTQQYFATNDTAWMVPGPNTWQTVPATGVGFSIPARRIITASFSAESQCLGGGWCAVRVLYSRNGGPLVELAPQSGTDYAFDSDGDAWDQHTVQRSSATYVPAGNIRVVVQAMRVGSTSFRLDDYHLNVGAVAP